MVGDASSDDMGTAHTGVDPSWPPERVAPGELERVRRFLNSVNLETGADRLAPLTAARRWLRAEGFAVGSMTRADLEHLRNLREQLRLFADGQTSLLARNPLVLRSALKVQVVEHDIALIPAGAGAGSVAAELLRIVADAQRVGTWSRLAVCANPSCRWAIYDNSRNGRSRWCSMSVCGDRLKARRYRDRRRHHEQQPRS